MKKYKFLILSCFILCMFAACNHNNPVEVNATNDNDGVDVDVPVSVNVEPHSDMTSVSGNVENNSNENNISVESGDVNINQGTINEIKSQNINVYVDKVLTGLVDINGNTVEPFADNSEIYVPLSSLSKILDKPVEYDRTHKAVYVGESPNHSTNMLDIIHGYDPQNITEYSFVENKGTEYFTMASNKYTDGMVAKGSYSTASINFNLKGEYNHLKFCFGHLDGTKMNPIKLMVKLDGYVQIEEEINAEDYPRYFDLDVTNAFQLRFEVDFNSSSSYAFTDMTLT